MRRAAGLGLLCAVASAGCHAPAPPVGETAALIQVADGQEFDRLWEVTNRVLRENRFYPVWEDRGGGVIETQPVTTGAWFEWWRDDVADAYSFLEAHISTIRRKVSVHISREPEPQSFRLAVRVEKSQLSQPERQVTSPAGAIQIFGSRLPTVEGRIVEASKVQSWLPLGRDGAVESRLLDDIIEAYGPAHCRIIEPELELPAGLNESG